VADSFEIDPVDWISAGAIGEPGSRTFYVQARKGGNYVALVVEKAQVAALAQLAQQLLGAVGITVTPDDLDEHAQRLVEPVQPVWRAGVLSLGADEQAERFLLEAQELVDEEDEEEEAAVARFWMGRGELVALAAYAAYAVTAGARQRCRFCSRPIDPLTGHVCPATNGHGPLTV
jgi:uncharacterized repeat protein (TIGR03847 family)